MFHFFYTYKNIKKKYEIHGTTLYTFIVSITISLVHEILILKKMG